MNLTYVSVYLPPKETRILITFAFLYTASDYFPRLETQESVTFRVFDAGSKTEFANNSLNSPKTVLGLESGPRGDPKNPRPKNLMLLSL